MEDLIELVAASFARHGIESPAGDPQVAWGQPPPAAQLQKEFARNLSVETGLAPSHSPPEAAPSRAILVESAFWL